MKRIAFVFLDLFIGIAAVGVTATLVYEARLIIVAIPTAGGWLSVFAAVIALIDMACGLFWCWCIGHGVRMVFQR